MVHIRRTQRNTCAPSRHAPQQSPQPNIPLLFVVELLFRLVCVCCGKRCRQWHHRRRWRYARHAGVEQSLGLHCNDASNHQQHALLTTEILRHQPQRLGNHKVVQGARGSDEEQQRAAILRIPGNKSFGFITASSSRNRISALRPALHIITHTGHRLAAWVTRETRQPRLAAVSRQMLHQRSHSDACHDDGETQPCN